MRRVSSVATVCLDCTKVRVLWSDVSNPIARVSECSGLSYSNTLRVAWIEGGEMCCDDDCSEFAAKTPWNTFFW